MDIKQFLKGGSNVGKNHRKYIIDSTVAAVAGVGRAGRAAAWDGARPVG